MPIIFLPGGFFYARGGGNTTVELRECGHIVYRVHAHHAGPIIIVLGIVCGYSAELEEILLLHP